MRGDLIATQRFFRKTKHPRFGESVRLAANCTSQRKRIRLRVRYGEFELDFTWPA